MPAAKKYEEQTETSPALERLARLKGNRGNGSRDIATVADSASRCVLEIDISRSLIDRMSDEEVYDFLLKDGADVLMEAFLSARSVILPRGVHGEISCKADSKGNIECKGSVSF